MRVRKSKKEEALQEEDIQKEVIQEESEEKDQVLSFDEFYSNKQSEMDFSKHYHQDWYMLGASPSQYPMSDENLESPAKAYENYLKENGK